MDLQHWLVHIWSWVRSFPWPTHDNHLLIGELGSGQYKCFVCGVVWVDEEETPEILEKELEEVKEVARQIGGEV